MRSNFTCIISMILATIAMSGCSNLELRRSTVNFDETVEKSCSAITDFYSALNRRARHHYYAHMRFDPTSIPNELSGVSYPGTGKNLFEPTKIAARIKVLQQLTNYTKGLALLALSDAPKRVEAELLEIGSNAKSIESKILSFNSSSNASSNVGAYIGFVSSIAGISMRNILEMKKDMAIKEYLRAGETPVKEAFILLKNDLGNLYSLYAVQKKAELSDQTRFYGRYFTVARAGAEADAMINSQPRNAFLDELETTDDECANLENGNPVKLVTAMEAAHNALVEMVQKPTDESNIVKAVNANLTTIESNLTAVSSAVNELQKHLKEK